MNYIYGAHALWRQEFDQFLTRVTVFPDDENAHLAT